MTITKGWLPRWHVLQVLTWWRHRKFKSFRGKCSKKMTSGEKSKKSICINKMITVHCLTCQSLTIKTGKHQWRFKTKGSVQISKSILSCIRCWEFTKRNIDIKKDAYDHKENPIKERKRLKIEMEYLTVCHALTSLQLWRRTLLSYCI